MSGAGKKMRGTETKGWDVFLNQEEQGKGGGKKCKLQERVGSGEKVEHSL